MTKSAGERYQDGVAGKPGWGVSWEYGRERGGWTTPNAAPLVSSSTTAEGVGLAFLVAFIVVFALAAWAALTFYFPLSPERRLVSAFIRMGMSPNIAPLAEIAAAFVFCCYVAKTVANRFGDMIARIVGLCIVGIIIYYAYAANHNG